jgi:septum formation protein
MLQRLGVTFTVRAPDVEELEHGEPEQITVENALRKARTASRPGAGEVVLACDTVVALDGTIHGKPADEAAARTTLAALSATTHEVTSGLALLRDGEPPLTATERTRVRFRALGAQLLDWYVARGEWRGRAGGYAIQGAGAALVESIDGDYANVVGLPLGLLLALYPELLGLRGAR